jgi:hypothetical protein
LAKKNETRLTDRRLGELLHRHVVEAGVAQYDRDLRTPFSDDVTDPTWRELLPFVQSLPADQRYVLLAFARLVATDTVSEVLGILDGSSGLPGAPDEFRLLYGKDPEPLTGSLQDSFLEVAEKPDPWVKRARAHRQKVRPARRR